MQIADTREAGLPVVDRPALCSFAQGLPLSFEQVTRKQPGQSIPSALKSEVHKHFHYIIWKNGNVTLCTRPKQIFSPSPVNNSKVDVITKFSMSFKLEKKIKYLK